MGSGGTTALSPPKLFFIFYILYFIFYTLYYIVFVPYDNLTQTEPLFLRFSLLFLSFSV